MYDPRDSDYEEELSEDYRGDYDTQESGTFNSWSDYEDAVEGIGDSDSSDTEE